MSHRIIARRSILNRVSERERETKVLDFSSSAAVVGDFSGTFSGMRLPL